MGHTLVVVHGNHVKTPLRRLRKMLLRERTKIVAEHGFNVAALLAVNCSLGRFDGASGAGFHLDEAQNVFVPPNQVNFAVMRAVR